MRPTTAAVKPNLNMSEWKGEPLHSMLFKQEKEDIAVRALYLKALRQNRAICHCREEP